MSYTSFDKQDKTGILYLNRVEKRNALNEEFMDELNDVLDSVEHSGIHALIVTSKGGNVFSSGGDISYFITLKSKTDAREMSFKMHNLLNRFEDIDILTLCVINGSAIGGGAELILPFDMRFLRSDSFIQFKEKHMGVTTGWGGTYRLVNLIGYTNALKVLMGAEKITADRALLFGLVNEVYDKYILMEKAVEFCAGLKDDDIRLIKHIKNLSKHSIYANRKDAMLKEEELFSEAWMFGKREKIMKDFLERL